ncbi:MAG: hypothetical protein RML84_10515, partial [Anaerolineae bacterium]|nr:hypothetical protein [Anaerolineae bacterium]
VAPPPPAPGAFSKVAPVNGATGVATNVTLQWQASGGASGYVVCVGTAPGLCDVVNQVSTSGTSYGLVGLAGGTTYWWQVVAVNANGQTPANGGQAWYFTTQNDPNAPPGPFNKLAPLSGSIFPIANTPSVVLSWSQSTGASSYHLCVSRRAGMCDVVNQVVSEATTSYTLSLSTLPAGTYWWQVRAISGSTSEQANDGEWWSFAVVYFTYLPSVRNAVPVP